jgi:hypothetical protein
MKMAKRKSKKNYSAKTPEQKQAEKEQLDGQINLLVNQIAAETDEAKQSEHFKRWVSYQSKFHHYSFHNTLLIMAQMPEATKVAGYKTWRDMGRQVVEKGKIRIFYPRFKNKEVEVTRDDGSVETEKQRRLTGFGVTTVFDISQTVGDPLPELEYRTEGDDKGTVPLLERMVQNLSIQLEYVDTLQGGAKGCSKGGEINVLSSLQGAERAATLTHEIAHELLHQGAEFDPFEHSRSTKEIEAEATAAVVLSALGLDMSASKFYLACWKGDGEKVRKSMDAIGKASKKILEFVLQEQQKEAKQAKAA